MTIGNVYTAKCRVFARIRRVMDGLDDNARSEAERSAEQRQGLGDDRVSGDPDAPDDHSDPAAFAREMVLLTERRDSLSKA